MGLLSSIKKVFTPAGEKQVQTKYTNYMLGMNDSLNTGDIYLSEKSVLSISDYMTAVDMIASTFAKIEFTFNKIDFKNGNKVKTRKWDSNFEYLLNRKPNDYQTPWQFKKSIIYNILLKERSVIYISTINGIASEFIPIDSNCIRVCKDELGSTLYYEFDDRENKVFKIPKEKILMLEYNTIDGFTDVGFNTIHKTILALLRQMDKLDLVVSNQVQTITGVIKVPENVTPEQEEAIRMRYSELVRSARESGSAVLVLDPKWEYESLDAKNTSSGVISADYRKDGIRRLCRALRIPMGKFGYPEMTGNSYKSVEELDLEFTKEAVVPFAEQFINSLNSVLLDTSIVREFGYDTYKTISHDFKTLSEVATRYINSGTMTPNEFRNKFLNLPPRDEGDSLMVNSATIPIELLTAEIENRIKNSNEQMKLNKEAQKFNQENIKNNDQSDDQKQEGKNVKTNNK